MSVWEKSNRPLARRILYGLALLSGGLVALAAPLLTAETAAFVLGLLMVGAGVVQALQILNAPGPTPAKTAFISPGASAAAGLLLLASPRLGFSAFAIMLGMSWIIDGTVRTAAAFRNRGTSGAYWAAFDGVFNILIGAAVAVQWPVSGKWSLGLFVGLRLLSMGWSMLLGREIEKIPAKEEEAADRHPDPRLGLPPDPEFAWVREAFNAGQPVRARTARHWRLVFVLTFFGIHLGRMNTGPGLAGLFPPAVATLGDVIVALLLAYLLVAPLRALWRWLTRPLERRAWQRYFGHTGSAGDRDVPPRGRGTSDTSYSPQWRGISGKWVKQRMRADLFDLEARRSASGAIGWGLSYGLALSALLIALNPIWGFSWFFNSENWVSIFNEQWSSQRADDWRQAMARGVRDAYPTVPSAELFRVSPLGVDGGGDFSFLVIGDPGEGDPSQLILRDQYLRLAADPDLKFLVISSDVIYPAGEMADYETKFYLPFKGFDKPIYALPGNHDWFDALDAFNANFFEAKAAIAALRARRAADLNVTTTTESDIADMVEQARWLQDQYGLKVGLQRAPFFDIQTERFALFVVDTGVLRTVDPLQMQWLRRALERARGKFKMAILGHPLYAAGEYRGHKTETFFELHRLLKEHNVEIVMAGDTHAFEHYREIYGNDGEFVMNHFTNGGGGAYLSIETPLDWPAQPPVEDWVYYPRTDATVAKLEAETPLWKRPMWQWVKHFHAWPSSTASVASAFDFNRAPFFQSFMEVRVEQSAGLVRLLLYGAHGRLRWRDLQLHGADGRGQGADEFVEFRLPLP